MMINHEGPGCVSGWMHGDDHPCSEGPWAASEDPRQVDALRALIDACTPHPDAPYAEQERQMPSWDALAAARREVGKGE